MQTLRTSQLAEQAGVGVETVRYYERAGLMPAPERTDAGYRTYPQGAVDRLRFIKQTQRLGFTLRDIAAMLALADGSSFTCGSARSIARTKLDDIDAKIAALHDLRKKVAQLHTRCSLADPTEQCSALFDASAILDRTWKGRYDGASRADGGPASHRGAPRGGHRDGGNVRDHDRRDG